MAQKNAEGYRWVPEAAGASATPLASDSRTLLVFDFDCTLSSVHLFKLLRSVDGQRDMARDPDGFFTRVFGGAERIAALQGFLKVRFLRTYFVANAYSYESHDARR